MKSSLVLGTVLAIILAPAISQADHRHYNRGSGDCRVSNHSFTKYSSYSRPSNYRPSYEEVNYYPVRRPFPQAYPHRPYSYRPHPGNFQSPYSSLIKQGAMSGRLSEREIRDLREDANNIRREEYEYRADGYLSKSERIDLMKDRQSLQKDLHHELNDGERRW